MGRQDETGTGEIVRGRKAALRRATRMARDQQSGPQRHLAAAAAVARLRRLPELRRAHVVALYAAHGAELDVGVLVEDLRDRGATTALPRVQDHDLALVATTAATPLEVGYRGVAEPRGRRVDLASVEVIVVPGLAFDPVGGRLGQGGGHYDRLLASLPAGTVRIGVGYACQLVPRVPCEPHDAVVDIVVTDRAVHRTDARA